MKTSYFLLFSLIFLASCTLMQEKTPSSTLMVRDTSMMTSETAMVQKDASTLTGYQLYTPELLANALKSGKNVALFFHATWCPSCKALDNTILTTLPTIPTDTLILKVDYDTSGDLKKKYGIVTQHTTLVLNDDGTEKSRKLGARSVTEIFE